MTKTIKFLFLIILFCFSFTNISCSGPKNRPKGEDWVSYHSPCWAPDSKHIIYIKNISRMKFNYGWLAQLKKSDYVPTFSENQICRMNIETGKEEIIRNFKTTSKFTTQKGWRSHAGEKDKKDFGRDTTPSSIFVFKKTGDIGLVTYEKKSDGSKYNSSISIVYRMNIKGNIIGKMVVNGTLPELSPDEKQILYRKNREIEKGYIPQLWLVNADGTDDRLLVDNASSGIWHPSGEKIAYFVSKENYSTYIMDLETKEKTLLVRNTSYPLDWAPEGKQISFASGIRDLDGKDIYWKTGISDKKWSPDGAKLLGKPMKKGSIGVFNINSKELKVLTTDKTIKY